MTRRSKAATDRALVVTLDAFRFSTRARKSALEYARQHPVIFLGLSAAGRTGRWDVPGLWQEDGVTIRQLPVCQPAAGISRMSKVRNALVSYVPAYLHLLLVILQTPARVVHVTGIPLGWLGLVHKIRFSSRFVYDVTERPGMIASPGSLATVFRHIEPLIIRSCSRWVDVAVVVTPADAPLLRSAGCRRVVLVRNAPNRAWRAPYRDPVDLSDTHPLSLSLIGSIFEGRGYERVIQALGRARQQGAHVSLRIIGPSRHEYLRQLRAIASSEGVDDAIEWRESVGSDQVSGEYLRGHVGLVLYDAADPGNDGLPNKLMECVATGRPVLATDLPQTRDFVMENGVGWVAPDDVESFAAAIVALAEADFASLSRRCRRLGDEWLNWESEFAQVVELLDRRAVGDLE